MFRLNILVLKKTTLKVKKRILVSLEAIIYNEMNLITDFYDENRLKGI